MRLLADYPWLAFYLWTVAWVSLVMFSSVLLGFLGCLVLDLVNVKWDLTRKYLNTFWRD